MALILSIVWPLLHIVTMSNCCPAQQAIVAALYGQQLATLYLPLFLSLLHTGSCICHRRWFWFWLPISVPNTESKTGHFHLGSVAGLATGVGWLLNVPNLLLLRRSAITGRCYGGGAIGQLVLNHPGQDQTRVVPCLFGVGETMPPR